MNERRADDRLASLQRDADLWSEVRVGPNRSVMGFVLDRTMPSRRFVVELVIDGLVAAIARAARYEPALHAADMGDGCHGFGFALDPSIEAGSVVAVRLANTDRLLGAAFRWANAAAPTSIPLDAGRVRWSGGLGLDGWVPYDPDQPPGSVRATIDGILVADVVPASWSSRDRGGTHEPLRAFALSLPASLADGRVRHVHVTDDRGRVLDGSPCAVVAFADGLERFLGISGALASETLRGALYDRLIPQSVPFGDFATWRLAMQAESVSIDMRSMAVAVVLVGEVGAEAAIDSLPPAADVAWTAAVFDEVEGPATFDPAAVATFLDRDAEACDVVVFTLATAVFSVDALQRLSTALRDHPVAPLAYCDIGLKASDGLTWPIAFPAFDHERTLEQGYGAYIFALSRHRALALLRGGAGDLFAVFLAAAGRSRLTSEMPVHVPGFLADLRLPPIDQLAPHLARASADSLRAAGQSGQIRITPGGALPAVHVARAAERRLISIVIATRDRADSLQRCLVSLHQTLRDTPFEVVVVDDGSLLEETRSFLETLTTAGLRLIRAPAPLGLAGLHNLGATQAKGDLLLFLDDGAECRQPGWLDDMVGRIAAPETGVVGAVLIAPSGLVRHAGYVLGPRFSVADALSDRRQDDPGYADMLHVAHQVGGVSAQCLLTRRSLFVRLNGFDAACFSARYADVDYGLRARQFGARLVMTPHARVTMHEQTLTSSMPGDDPWRSDDMDLSRLRSRWGNDLINDPFYTPMLSLGPRPYSGLACPPRERAARQPDPPAPAAVPPGF
ncbi:glycosyltransferase family 2 protein [Lichenihabitans psoromatis]|uniref:glycosyltransferase family 2 protein n=1 Tax=Lichenihabitans psoromatis TaxID=2528642 RepID=UPI0010383D65|nr:glycosyltransferase [Lichenihabitans psoromatis]